VISPDEWAYRKRCGETLAVLDGGLDGSAAFAEGENRETFAVAVAAEDDLVAVG